MAYRTAPDTSCAFEIGEHLVGQDVTLTLSRGQIIDIAAPRKFTRIIVTTTCTATVFEEWTLEVTDEQLAAIREDQAVGLNLINGEATFVNVENVKVEHEHDREMIAFDVTVKP